MEVKIKKLHPDAVIPKKQSVGASGFDLYSIEDAKWEPIYADSIAAGIPGTVIVGYKAIVGTGIAMSIPVGYEMQVRPRSGLAANETITVINTPGTIDADYRGEVKVILIRHGGRFNKSPELKKGERIAQGVICEVPNFYFTEVEELDDTERGAGGLGSTGRHG